MIQDLIQRHFGVVYHPHYIATWLKNMGFSYQKARFVSDHLNAAKRLARRQSRWPKILRQAKKPNALLLFGDEASFAQWGSLSYTWALRGQQPEVPTSGKGLQGLWAHRLFLWAVFLQNAHGTLQLAELCRLFARRSEANDTAGGGVQDGARYHTSKAMQAFFETYADRLTIEQLPAYSPDFNPIEHLWKKVKKEATHLKHFPAFTDLQQEVDRALIHFAQTPSEITVLMVRYCEKLGRDPKRHPKASLARHRRFCRFDASTMSSSLCSPPTAMPA
jgi:transposase